MPDIFLQDKGFGKKDFRTAYSFSHNAVATAMFLAYICACKRQFKMRKLVLFVFAAAGMAGFAQAQRVGGLSDMARKDGLAVFSKNAQAKQPLDKKAALQMRDTLVEVWKESVREQSRVMWSACDIRNDSLSLKFDRRIYGAKPENGRSLYISLHGGGGMTHEFNDHQWDNQTKLYKPAEGVYISPRAPWDAWNMWFKPGLDELFEELIEAEIAWDEVNPDKVYLLGYSAGGDGVWRMAPRMGDHWASASMMAGHPGDAGQENLLNVPFMIWMGEHDTEYNRNALAVEKGHIMDSLQQNCQDGYIHSLQIVKGKGHWMEHQDTAAIAWMAKYERLPLPAHIIWRQEDVTRPTFYWLGIDLAEASHGKHVEVFLQKEKNEIEITRCDYKHISIFLNDEMLNLDKPVSVTYKGRNVYNGSVSRTASMMAETLNALGDPHRCFSARIDVIL